MGPGVPELPSYPTRLGSEQVPACSEQPARTSSEVFPGSDLTPF